MTGRRPRNPRVVIHEALKTIKRHLTVQMLKRWDQDQTIHDRATKTWRKRTDAEKVENDPAEWEHLARWAEFMQRQFRDVEIFAKEQVDHLSQVNVLRAKSHEGGAE